MGVDAWDSGGKQGGCTHRERASRASAVISRSRLFPSISTSELAGSQKTHSGCNRKTLGVGGGSCSEEDGAAICVLECVLSCFSRV